MTRGWAICPVALLLLAARLAAGQTLDLEDETVRASYSLGHQIGEDLARQGVALDAEALVRGFEDAQSGAEPLLGPSERQQRLRSLERRIVSEERARRREAELEQLARGRAFLEENARKPGVVTTASGLQYLILEPGTGRRPGPTDAVTLHYRGTRIDGHEVDGTRDGGEPASFELGGVIKGWTEGLQLIREGGKIRLFLPPDLAFGDRGPLAHRTLVYEVELISVGPAR